MPRILALALLALPLALPASAHAKLSALRIPHKQACAPIKLGVFASKHHHGSRTIRVVIRDSDDDVRYRKTVRARKGRLYEWRKMLPCGQPYEVTYRFPRGSELVYNVKVKTAANSQEVPPVVTPVPGPGPGDDVPDDPRPNTTPTPEPVPTATPTPNDDVFSFTSSGEVQYLVMDWWRGSAAAEVGKDGIPDTDDDVRAVGTCSGPGPDGDCRLGAHKFFRPREFVLGSVLDPKHPYPVLWLDVPQYEGGVNTFDHYSLPIELVKTGCTFQIQHIRTHGRFEFPLNPPGLEILPHTFYMTKWLCDHFDPTSNIWVPTLNEVLNNYLVDDDATYDPPDYPYSDPRTGRDPSQ